ncbi:hypothetical protein FRC03_010003 [Tulasnella sp. 419]|nr:hypothetical protein FRC03_010003 [Tulasnella sp. 419]
MVDVTYDQFTYVSDGGPEWAESYVDPILFDQYKTCSHKYTPSTNVSFSYTFNGTGFTLYLPRCGNCGLVKLVLDGDASVVNTFNEKADCSIRAFNIQELPQGLHTINGSLLGSAHKKYMKIWKLQYTADPDTKSDSRIGPIAGGVGGGVALLAIVAIILYVLRRRNKQRQQYSFDIDAPNRPHQVVDPWVDRTNGQRPAQGYNSQMSDKSGPLNNANSRGSIPRRSAEQNLSLSNGGSSSDSSQPYQKAAFSQHSAQNSSTLPQGTDIQNLVQMVTGAVISQLQQSPPPQQSLLDPHTMQPQMQPQHGYPVSQPPPSFKSAINSLPPGAAPPRLQSPPAYHEQDPLARSRHRVP